MGSVKSIGAKLIKCFAALLSMAAASCESRSAPPSIGPNWSPYILLFPTDSQSYWAALDELCNSDEPALGGAWRDRDVFRGAIEDTILLQSAGNEGQPKAAFFNLKDNKFFAYVGLSFVGTISPSRALLYDGRGRYSVSENSYDSMRQVFTFSSEMRPVAAGFNKLGLYDPAKRILSVFDISNTDVPRQIFSYPLSRHPYQVILGDESIAVATFRPSQSIPILEVQVLDLNGIMVSQYQLQDPEAELVAVRNSVPLVLSRRSSHRCLQELTAVPEKFVCGEDLFSTVMIKREVSTRSFEETFMESILRAVQKLGPSPGLQAIEKVARKCIQARPASEDLQVVLHNGKRIRATVFGVQDSRGVVFYFKGGPYGPVGPASYDRFIEAMLARRLKVVVTYPPGTAGFDSSYVDSFGDFEAVSADIAAFIHDVRQKDAERSQVVLVAGLSFGGQYALSVSGKSANVQGVVLIDPSCDDYLHKNMNLVVNMGFGYIQSKYGSSGMCQYIGTKPTFIYHNTHDQLMKSADLKKFLHGKNIRLNRYVKGVGEHGEVNEEILSATFEDWLRPVSKD